MRAELLIAQVQGEDKDVFRVSIILAEPTERQVLAKFEIEAGTLMKALTGRFTQIVLKEWLGE